MDNLIVFAFTCALAGFIWVNVLIAPSGIFVAFTALIADPSVPEWVYHLFTCPMCIAGQLALWLYIILYMTKYNPLEHFTAVVWAIGSALFLNKLWDNLHKVSRR